MPAPSSSFATVYLQGVLKAFSDFLTLTPKLRKVASDFQAAAFSCDPTYDR
jgi:hypothetical protein